MVDHPLFWTIFIIGALLIGIYLLIRRRSHPTKGEVIGKEMLNSTTIQSTEYVDETGQINQINKKPQELHKTFILTIKSGRFENRIYTDEQSWKNAHIGDQYSAKSTDVCSN